MKKRNIEIVIRKRSKPRIIVALNSIRYKTCKKKQKKRLNAIEKYTEIKIGRNKFEKYEIYKKEKVTD